MRELELEEQDRRGYLAQPQREDDFRVWEEAAQWPEDSAVAMSASFDSRLRITSAIRGVPSEVILDADDGMKGRCAVNLHNPITVEQARLGRRVANLSAGRMQEVCAALRFSLGCG